MREGALVSAPSGNFKCRDLVDLRDVVDGAGEPQLIGSVQFSIWRSCTRPNSRVLFITSVSPRLRACAARRILRLVRRP
jgi:hypothetical protein